MNKTLEIELTAAEWEHIDKLIEMGIFESRDAFIQQAILEQVKQDTQKLSSKLVDEFPWPGLAITLRI